MLGYILTDLGVNHNVPHIISSSALCTVLSIIEWCEYQKIDSRADLGSWGFQCSVGTLLHPNTNIHEFALYCTFTHNLYKTSMSSTKTSLSRLSIYPGFDN